MSERLTDAAIREAMAPRPWAPGAFDHDLRLVAAEALARGTEAEGLRAEVERLTRSALRTSAPCPSCGDDISFPSARATIEDAPADAIEDGAESFCRECNVRARWTGDAETPGSVVLDYDDDRKEYQAEVARLRSERDRAIRLACKMTQACIDSARHNRGATFSIDDSDEANKLHALLNEPGLRAAAIPEDAEERIARTCFEWDRGATWDERTNSDVENYTDQARAVLAALRGDA